MIGVQDGGEAPIIDLGLDQLRDPTDEPMDFSEHNFDQVNQDDQLDLLETELSCGQVQNSPFTGLSQVSSKRESIIQPKISSSLFDMAKKYQKSEEVSHAMNEGLAESINSIFREGLSEDSLGTLLKAKEATRPNNCPALCTPRVDDLMWRILSPPAQSRDKLFQNLQTLMIKGSTMLARLVEKLDENGQEQFVESGLDALAVFGHASRQLINRRRDLLRSEIQPDFAHLCSNSTPVTDKLFGDNVTDNVKEIQNIKRVERVITKRWRGRQQPYPYQGAGPRFQGYRPQQQWPRGSFQPRGRFFPRGRGGPNRMRNPNWTRGQASSTVTRASHKKAE